MSGKWPSKFEIARKAKAREKELLKAIHLMCGECMGFFLDPYTTCTDKVCPLRPYYPTKGMTKSPHFKNDLARLAKSYGNPTETVSKIKKLEAEIGSNKIQKRRKRGKWSNHTS